MLSSELQKEVVLKEIDAPWVIEWIEAKFDDALLMLTDRCIIYGGAVRDILAKLPIAGDLDVAVPYSHYLEVTQALGDSSRWICTNPNKQTNQSYNDIYAKIISSVTTYTNNSNEKLQLVKPVQTRTHQDSEYDEGAITIVTNVDLLCCGVMMDVATSKVYETNDGAHDDCINKVLNINPSMKKEKSKIRYEVLTNRVHKLVKRGWKDNTNVKK